MIELTPAGVAVMKGEQPPPASLADLMPRRADVVPSSSSSGRRIVRISADDSDGNGVICPRMPPGLSACGLRG